MSPLELPTIDLLSFTTLDLVQTITIIAHSQANLNVNMEAFFQTTHGQFIINNVDWRLTLAPGFLVLTLLLAGERMEPE